MPNWQALRDALETDGIGLGDPAPRPVGGGDISAAWSVSGNAGRYFLKTSTLANQDMFAAEKAGLDELRAAAAVRVPEVLAQGATRSDSYLALEWLDLAAPDSSSERDLGAKLALQHRVTAEKYGWRRNNTIGLTPQLNPETPGWADFFVQHRLAFQIDLAIDRGFSELEPLRAAAIDGARRRLGDHRPPASLLHGDLWGGNHASVNGSGVVFDPAVYFGDRETDLAMTRLFGGFAASFYAAYEEAWPLPADSERRCALYQLYHVLNHVNLFGRSYLGRARSMLEELAAGRGR